MAELKKDRRGGLCALCSVYRQFGDLNTFGMDELKDMLSSRSQHTEK